MLGVARCLERRRGCLEKVSLSSLLLCLHALSFYLFFCSHCLHFYHYSFTTGFKMRSEHKAPVIGEFLYLWAGNQVDLPRVHDSLQKRELTSTVDVYQLSTAHWSSHLTRGTPPLGVAGYSCTTSHSNIYYFAGACNHDNCYHNTLNVLNTIKMQWTSCSNAEQSLMKKAFAGMISLDFDGAEYLVIMGGTGSTPTVYHPQFQYDQLKTGRVRTNEQLLYNVSTGKILFILIINV